MTKKIHKMIDATLARLVTLEDEQGKAHTPEWERLEGYYYGLLDALKATEGDCAYCGEGNPCQDSWQHP